MGLSEKNERRATDFDIKVTWLAISRMYNVRATREGLTTNIGFVLLHIDEEKGTPATKIAPLMGMESRSLTRMLARLEELNWIYRQSDAKDKRLVRIFLTAEGKRKRTVAKEVVVDFNKEISKRISGSQLNTFFDVIDQIQQIINEKHHAYSRESHTISR